MGGEDYDFRFNNFWSKHQLIHEIQSLALEVGQTPSEWRDITERAKNLMEEWKSYGSVACKEAYEMYNEPHEDMWEEFNGAMQEIFANKNTFFEDLNAEFEARAQEKSHIIEMARALLERDDAFGAMREYQDLMNSWKAVGSAGASEEELWEDFKGIGSDLRARREAFATQRNAEMQRAEKRKREVIDEARQLANSVDWKATTQRFRELFDEMKNSGRAKREVDDALWSEFKGYKNHFHERRIAYFSQKRTSPPT